MKYRIKVKEETNYPTVYYPQKKYRFWPFWFSCKEFIDHGELGSVPDAVRYIRKSDAEQYLYRLVNNDRIIEEAKKVKKVKKITYIPYP